MINANWICPPTDLGDVCPIFRRDFACDAPLKKAELYISARGVYEAEINCKRVGDFIMAPGWTDYSHRIQLQQYDVTDLIDKSNTLTVILSNGWFCGMKRRGKYRPTEPSAVIALLKLEYENGKTELIPTDESWTVSESKVRYCDIFDGIVFDAGFVPSFTEHAAVSEYNDTSILVEQSGEAVKEHEVLSPIEIITTPNGETVIDFGQNLTGYVQITLDAHFGDKVSLSFGEILDKNGNFYNANYRSAKALYEYTCSDGKQTFKPILTFYGFRYVRVNSFPVPITSDAFKAIAVYSDIRQTGRIETSDPLINKLFENIIWGQKDNFLDVPTDCPQRDERLGWTGDAQVFMRTASYNFDVNRFFKKWLEDMALEQCEDGCIPKIIPSLFKSTSSAWGDAVTICPWQHYLTYGDKSILEKMFEPMIKWVDYITCTTEKEHLWFGGKHYGDWLELDAPINKMKGETRDELVASAFYACSTELLCKTGRVLGKDVAKYEELYNNIVKAFKNEFNDTFRTQTEHVLPLYFRLTDRPEEVALSLVEKIRCDGNAIKTGFVGTPYIMHVLSKYGYNELAYTLLLRREYPSWLYPVTKGATTMWEHWDGIKPNGDFWPEEMNSFNHYAYGAIGDWLYGVAAGINTVEDAPGFQNVYFAPVPDNRLDWFKAEIDTKYGKVASMWRHENGKTVYMLTTPVPSTAEINGRTYTLEAGTHIFTE